MQSFLFNNANHFAALRSSPEEYKALKSILHHMYYLCKIFVSNQAFFKILVSVHFKLEVKFVYFVKLWFLFWYILCHHFPLFWRYGLHLRARIWDWFQLIGKRTCWGEVSEKCVKKIHEILITFASSEGWTFALSDHI